MEASVTKLSVYLASFKKGFDCVSSVSVSRLSSDLQFAFYLFWLFFIFQLI